MLAPIRPSPIMPSCILCSYKVCLLRVIFKRWARVATEPPELERSLAEWGSVSGWVEVHIMTSSLREVLKSLDTECYPRHSAGSSYSRRRAGTFAFRTLVPFDTLLVASIQHLNRPGLAKIRP